MIRNLFAFVLQISFSQNFYWNWHNSLLCYENFVLVSVTGIPVQIPKRRQNQTDGRQSKATGRSATVELSLLRPCHYQQSQGAKYLQVQNPSGSVSDKQCSPVRTKAERTSHLTVVASNNVRGST